MRHVPLFFLVAFCAGCNLGLDPDSLVRELRILGVRVGDAAPGSIADLDMTKDQVHVAALVAAPTGPGRRVPADRPISLDWYLCLSGRSLISPGSLDPACALFGPMDPDARSGKNPALLYLGSGAETDLSLAGVRAGLQQQIIALLAGGTGGGPGLPQHALSLSLALVLHASAAPGSTDPRDSETAFFYVRLVVAPPGIMPPPPNHNPTLMQVLFATDAAFTTPMPLSPCQADVPCQRVPVKRNQPFYLRALPTPDSAEQYTPLDDSGRMNIKEVLRYAWFSTDGQFSEERTGDMMPDTMWMPDAPYTPPPEVPVMQIWVVQQDDRYGTAWQLFEFQLGG